MAVPVIRKGVEWHWLESGEGKIRPHWKSERTGMTVRVLPPDGNYCSWYVIAEASHGNTSDEFEYERRSEAEAFELAGFHARSSAMLLI